MKILKFVILISFLFNSVAYPYENASNTLRLPMMLGDKESKERLESARKFVSVQEDYMPGGAFAGWEETEEAIKQRFTSAKERKEALQFVRAFAKKLVKNKISPFYTLRDAIPSIVPILKNPKDMQVICGMLFNLNMLITKNELEMYGALVEAIPAIAKAAKNIDELKLFVNLGIKLAENKIDPIDTLYHIIPAVVKVAKTYQELKDMCDVLFNLNIKLAENEIDSRDILQYAIPTTAKAAKSTQELKDMCDALLNLNIKLPGKAIPAVAKAAKNIDELKLFVNLGIKLAENEEMTSDYFANIVKQSSAAAGDSFYDLQEICNDVIPKMASKIEEARVFEFITAGHIGKALELQLEYGDFKIAYNHEYDPGDVDNGIVIRPSSESYKIQVSPPGSKSTKLASGQNAGATDQKKKPSMRDYRPGWTFAGWGAAKKAIKLKFESTKERKEALQLVRTFARKLAENKINPHYILRDTIPVLVKLAGDMDGLELFINLGIKLAENKINPYYTLKYAIQAAAEAAKTPQELEDLCGMLFDLNIKLAENKINPYDTLCNAIPAAAKAAKNTEELKLFINLGIIFAENKISTVYALQRVIRDITKVPKPTQEIKDICDALFNLNIKLAENNKANSASFYHLVVQSFEAAGDNFQNFKEICNNIIPKMASNIGEARVLNFIRAGHIRKALELQREYGDFKITYNYEYALGGIGSDKVNQPSSESCQIKVLPHNSTSAELASTSNIKPANIDYVQPVADAYPKAAMITSKAQLFKLKLSEMSEDDIERCLKALMQTGGVSNELHRAISKKLMKLQEKRPETSLIIKEKGLKLLKFKYGDSINDLGEVRDQI